MPPPTTAIGFSGTTPPAPPGLQNTVPQSDGAQPFQRESNYMPLAVPGPGGLAGAVKPDGTSITMDADGTIHAAATGTGGGGGGTSASGGLYVCVSPTQDPADGTGTQFILPAPVLAGTDYWLNRNDTVQRQLGTKAYYSVQGTQLTLASPLEADGYLEFHYIQGTPNSQSGGGGSVTPVAPGTVRGVSTGAAATGSNSFAVAWPTGTQIGDLVVIQATSDWNLSVPSGWTSNNLDNGGTWNGLVISKVMTSGDIATGSVTITSAGNQDYSFIAVAFIGPTGGIRETDVSNSTGGFSVATSSAVQATDVGLYFGSGRGAGTAITIARGTQIASVTGTNSQAQVNAESIAAGGTVSVGYVYGGGGGGCYSAVVIVKGS